jgi:potassium uptake TrkH family protein
LSFFGLIALVFDFGYDQSAYYQTVIENYYFIVLTTGLIATLLRNLRSHFKSQYKVLFFDSLSSLFILLIFLSFFVSVSRFEFLTEEGLKNLIRVAVFLTFIREIAASHWRYNRTIFNPAQLFIFSFFGLIVLGAFLLMLPNATYGGITFIDAVFTSTSAVCVTGLTVVDTATYFTLFGQLIVLTLIQLGGLGILTIASYFSFFFKGVSSYENQIVLSDISNSNKLGEIFNILKVILVITFSIELVGAIAIYSTLDTVLQPSFLDRAYFSTFHSVSSFCNAGFSTLTNSLYDSGFRFNYSLHLVLISLLVLGGLGFPIVSNIVKYFRYVFLNRLLPFRKERKKFIPWVLNINSRITLITTLALTVVGTLLFYFAEYNNTLVAHEGFGKVVTSLFGATTPRTAGFNSVDTASLKVSTLMIVIFLMWVGASPASTGGGIKTSTFAIALLNILSLAKGKNRVEIFRREIADSSVHRAFAVIMLSLVVIAIGIVSITYFDSDKQLLSIAFETVSAFSTVGLSMGITAQLSVYSKTILVLVMFFGRVSMLTILIAFVRKERYKNYLYPSEEITIN